VSGGPSRVASSRLRSRGRRSAGTGPRLLAAAAGLLVAVAVVQTLLAGVVAVKWALAFAALIALGELLRLNLPGDREAAPIGTACALAYALLIQVGTTPARHSALQVVAVTGIGMTLGVLPHLAVGRPARVSRMAARLICVACVAYIFRPLAGIKKSRKATGRENTMHKTAGICSGRTRAILMGGSMVAAMMTAMTRNAACQLVCAARSTSTVLARIDAVR